MADYQPLIARAVAGLDNNTGENRRTLYERARTALVAQLRSISPALNESDITRERLALEDAIRKVESDAVRRGRGEYQEDDQFPDTGEVAASSRPPSIRPSGPSLSDQGLQGFRQTVAEAQGLGDASAQASKSARQAYDAVPEAERRAPYSPRDRGFGSEVAPPPESFAAEPAALLPHEEPSPIEQPHGEAPRVAESPPPAGSLEPETMPETLPEFDPAPNSVQESASESFRQSLPDSRRERPPVPPRYDEVEEEYRGPRRSYRGAIKWLIILLLVGGVAGAGYWQRAQIGAVVALLRTSAPTPAQRQAAPERPKITDRVGSNEAPRSATAPTADVAQKVVLYDEDQADPQGKRYVGSAVWRTETVSPGPGLAPELAIRADVDIPERRMRMSWSLRRNTDKALPASHTIEILFTLPADFPEGGIANIPGVLMKQNRADPRRAAGRSRGEGHQRIFPDRAVGRRSRSATQHPAAQGAVLV